MDSEERALLAAIVAHPDEDTPRLVYADWLQEHDRAERAELIRAQIGLARTKGLEGFERQRHEWNSRARELLHRHSKQWRKELPKFPRVVWGPFERGVVESAALRIWEWTPEVTGQLSALFDHTPLRRLQVNFYSWRGHRPDECDEMLRWGGAERVDEFCLAGFSCGTHPAAPFFDRLWAHKWSDRPRAIDLHEARVSDEVVNPLVTRPADAGMPILRFTRTALSESMRGSLAARFGHRVQFVN